MDGFDLIKGLLSLQAAHIIVDLVAPMIPEAASALKSTTQEYGVDPLGAMGVNLYSCSDYMSAGHFDHDACMGACMQYRKRSKPDEFNFAYTQWGVYIETQDNCAWWVSY